ncbi:MAG: right-handed parallel beta-helix repeat-containing protein, partial [Verrucomicrobia bacterium]|nr:right-handed parallel beta-helix repeat-containing protein [Verrucomicrobiota bacterium]
TTWPNAFISLATALAAASSGDEIWVAKGTYTPAPSGASRTNRFQIRHAIRLYGGFTSSMTTLDQRDPYRHVTTLSGDLNGDDQPGFANRFDNAYNVIHIDGVDGGPTLDGFTIRGGYGSISGAGLYLADASPFVVSRCTFTDNYIVDTGLGGGMWCSLGATGTVRHCIFYNNYSGFRAGGFGIDGYLAPYARVDMVNCTITGNDAAGEGDGVYARANTIEVLSIKNCIIWDNDAANPGAQNIRERGDATLTITYTDFDRALSSSVGGIPSCCGLGWMTEDPLFADEAAADFHLQSEDGRPTPTGLVFDDVTSPCVDAGNPADPCDEEPQFEPCRIDMGAYGGTQQASGSIGRAPRGLLLNIR